jgi:phosphatidylglycerophosphatase C
MADGVRALAIFDLDGTITRHDTLWPYVTGWLAQRPLRFLRLMAVLPAALAFLLTRDRGALKSALIRHSLGGVTRAEIERWNAAHLPEVVRLQLHHEAVEAIESHRSRGDHLVLMSASVDCYVPELARRLGIDDVICTGLTWNGDQLEGRLSTPNVRGEVKAQHFRALRAKYPGSPITAYGNSGSDLPHLLLAERGVLVNGNASARRAAAANHIECVRWGVAIRAH